MRYSARISQSIAVLHGVILALWFTPGIATDRYYADREATSANSRLIVEAKSPDNATGRFKPWQASFEYVCRDAKSGMVLWTRRQKMGLPDRRLGLRLPEETSPIGLFVDDSAWTVILHADYRLTAVDPVGADRWTFEVLEDGLTDTERTEHVHVTTAGPLWTGLSEWYFLEGGGEPKFVIRPWWGRRIVIDLASGKLINASPPVLADCEHVERRIAMDSLDEALAELNDENHGRYLTAAFLAGKLEMKEAIPALRRLEESEYQGSSVLASGDVLRRPGRVMLDEWSEFTARRIAQLSLRRLGERPRPFPGTELLKFTRDGEAAEPYQPTPREGDRSLNATLVKPGMSPEDVVGLIGAPDFNDESVWHFEMDAAAPYTLTILWKQGRVERTQPHRPPLWTTDRWDREFAY